MLPGLQARDGIKFDNQTTSGSGVSGVDVVNVFPVSHTLSYNIASPETRMMTIGMWLRKPINFRMLSTPHDLAIFLGPWICLSLILGLVVATNFLGIWSVIVDSIFVALILNFPTDFFRENCDALNVKYATEGVRLQGSFKHGQVFYQVDDVQYSKEFELPKNQQQQLHATAQLFWISFVHYSKEFELIKNQQQQQQAIDGVFESSTTAVVVDLVRLPGYPKSAILATSVKPVKPMDPDIPPRCRDFSLLYRFSLQSAILVTTDFMYICLFPWSTLLWEPILMSIPFFICGYWLAARIQERKYPQLLYGAKQVQDKDGIAPLVSSSEEHVSSDELFQLDHSQRFSYPTVLRIAVEEALWLAYFCVFLGSYYVMYRYTVPRWKRTLLERYDSESDTTSFTVGSFVYKGGDSGSIYTDITAVIVQYKADDNRWYKKRLDVPVEVVKNMPDCPELVYLKGHPESAICKDGQALLDQGPSQTKHVLFSILFMVFQIGVQAFLIVYPSSGTEFLREAGILLVCHFVMGFVGVWIYYKTVVERDILGGAKQVYDGSTQMETSLPTIDDTAGQANHEKLLERLLIKRKSCQNGTEVV